MPLLINNNGVKNIPIEDSALTSDIKTDYDEVIKHQKKYTKLLSMYTNSTRINLYAKIAFKILFFLVTMYIWILMTKLFVNSFDIVLDIIKNQNNNESYIQTTINLLAAVVPSLVSLITSFIIIPKVIAKYLFNINEENSMIEIIKSLQVYDNKLYKHRYHEELLAHEEYNKNNDDINIS